MQRRNSQPFILKAGDLINDQSNDHRPNSKLKTLYNISKVKWMLKYGNTTLQPHLMNSILVETWEAFMVSSGDIIRYSCTKTHLLPLSPPNMITTTHACYPPSKSLQHASIRFQKTHLHLSICKWKGPTTLWWSSGQRVVLNNHREKLFSGR